MSLSTCSWIALLTQKRNLSTQVHLDPCTPHGGVANGDRAVAQIDQPLSLPALPGAARRRLLLVPLALDAGWGREDRHGQVRLKDDLQHLALRRLEIHLCELCSFPRVEHHRVAYLQLARREVENLVQLASCIWDLHGDGPG